MIYEVTRRWQGRWREETIGLPAGSLVVKEGADLTGVDTGDRRVFVLEGECVDFIERDSPGTLVEYQPPKPKAEPKTREMAEPPADRQVKKASSSRRRRKKKEVTDDEEL